MRSSDKIGNSTHPSSPGSTPPHETYHSSASADPIPSGEPFTTALPLAVDASTEEASRTSQEVSSTSQEVSSTTQEEAKMATTGGRHFHTGL